MLTDNSFRGLKSVVKSIFITSYHLHVIHGTFHLPLQGVLAQHPAAAHVAVQSTVVKSSPTIQVCAKENSRHSHFH